MPPKLRTKLSMSTEPDVSQKAGEVVTMATVRELLKAKSNNSQLKIMAMVTLNHTYIPIQELQCY